MPCEVVQTIKVEQPKPVFDQDGVQWRWPHLVVLKAEVGPGRDDSWEESITYNVVELTCEVRDRSTGELMIQRFQFTFDDRVHSGLSHSARTARILRDAYLRLCAHELDELLRVDGAWKDPHVVIPAIDEMDRAQTTR